MNCRFCGTALPEDAVFCGECGRPASAVTGRRRVSMPTVAVAGRSGGGVAFVGESPTVLDVQPISAGETTACPQCGRIVLATDVFCGDCGFVLGSTLITSPESESESESVPASEPESEFDGVAVNTAPREVAVSAPLVDDSEITEIARDSAPDAHEPEPDAESEVLAEASPFAPDLSMVAARAAALLAPVAAASDDDDAPRPATPLRSVPDPFPWGAGPSRATVDLEKTRAVATGPAEERYVLQFSTGESVTVTGAGLVGRNPSSQPGEFVDQLVTIFDAGKSVSKTHLEFGQDSGRFWVSDRYSTNGSTVRQPDMEPKRCDPGRRYFIARGSRVDIGEQFFVVS